MARPKAAEGEGLRNFTVRLSDDDRAQIEKTAANIGLTPSEYVRRSALNKTVRTVPDERKPDPDLLRSLLAIGNNLNQIARKLNATDQVPANLNDALDTFTAFMKAHLPPRDNAT